VHRGKIVGAAHRLSIRLGLARRGGDMATLTLYGPAPSSYVRTARMTCVEKGVSHELAPIALGSEEHLALHPFGKVPVLDHGSVRLYETQAIIRYVDAAFEGPSLVPHDAAAMATMEQWISVHNCYLYPHLIKDYSFAYILPQLQGKAPDLAAAQAAMPGVEHDLGLLERGLEGKTWLAGTFSLADLLVAPVVATVGLFPEGGPALDRRPNVRRWLTAIERRESGSLLYPPR
jgi:glutathione S-transferase